MLYYSGRIHFTEMFSMVRNMEPPVGFGKKCPNRLAYRVRTTAGLLASILIYTFTRKLTCVAAKFSTFTYLLTYLLT